MKSIKKRLPKSVFVALMLVLMLALVPAQALAVSFSPEKSCGNRWTVNPKGELTTGYETISFDDYEGDLTITNLKSSNKDVATVEKDKDGDYLFIAYGSRCGKTTISCTANGVKLSKVFRVKYVSPLKSFTVAGKNLTSKFRKKNIFTDNRTFRNKRVVIKAKSGWVITQVVNTKKFKSTTKKYKGKTKVALRINTVAPYDGLRITFKNKKTGVEQEVDYTRGFHRTGYRPVAG